ncbi:glycosyl hydrolase family 18 protein [Syntrophomonas erecta]
MGRKSIVLLLFTVLVLGSFTYSAAGSSDINIRINGNLRHPDPPAHIKDNRTMVPVRFVVEDEELNGKVYWDQNQKKVAMDCRGKYLEFFLGKTEAKMDGQSFYMDTAPYIYRDRTFIPLRFLAEALGATVAWKNTPAEVDIRFDQPQSRVFAYYYYTPEDEMQRNVHLLTDIAFRWFAATPKGELYYEYQADYQKTLQWARQKGIKTHASVVLMGQDVLHELLSSSDNRNRMVNNLVTAMYRDNYDGINIDFELMAPADAANFTTFLRELKQSMGQDKELTVAVFARTGNEKWATPYEYDKIGQIADAVVVMAYDYHYSTSKPGPVAPLWWVEQVGSFMARHIPAQKVLLGMATYGYDWPTGTRATAVTASKLAALKQKYQVEQHFDDKSMSPYYTYRDSNNNYHEIWLENERSLSEKWKVVSRYQLGGISFWRIGNGFEDLYRVIEKNQ